MSLFVKVSAGVLICVGPSVCLVALGRFCVYP